MERISAWLNERRPLETSYALIHNDYKYDNVVLDPTDVTRIVGVLDWEMLPSVIHSLISAQSWPTGSTHKIPKNCSTSAGGLQHCLEL